MKIKRIFRCENGHEYESRKPLTCGIHDILLEAVGSDLRIGNDKCKICGAKIISESDYVKGKLVMGAVLA